MDAAVSHRRVWCGRLPVYYLPATLRAMFSESGWCFFFQRVHSSVRGARVAYFIKCCCELHGGLHPPHN